MRLERKQKKLLVFVSDENPIWRELADIELEAGEQIAANGLSSRPSAKNGHKPKKGHKAPTKDAQVDHPLRRASDRHSLLGKSDDTVRDWRHGDIRESNDGGKAIRSVQDALIAFAEKLRTALKDAADAKSEDLERLIARVEAVVAKVDAYRRDYETPASRDLTVYDAAKILGVSTRNAQLVLDRVIYEPAPLLCNSYYTEKSKADAAYAEVGGLYVAWMRRGSTWMRCTLAVRYVLKQGPGYVLRAKLNLPMLDPTPAALESAKERKVEHPYWEYDGFVRILDSTIFWVFEKRDPLREDYVFIVTEERIPSVQFSDDGRLVNFSGFSGKYLTTQSNPIEPIVTDRVILDVLDRNDRLTDQSGKHARDMWHLPRVLEASDPKLKALRELESLLRDNGSGRVR